MSASHTSIGSLLSAIASLLLLSTLALVNPLAKGAGQQKPRSPLPGVWSPASSEDECPAKEMRHDSCEPRYVKLI